MSMTIAENFSGLLTMCVQFTSIRITSKGDKKKKKKYEKLKGERGGEKNDWEEGAA